MCYFCMPSSPALPTRQHQDTTPFFTFFYVDDHVAAARGRSGGLALWSRTSPMWEMENYITRL